MEENKGSNPNKGESNYPTLHIHFNETELQNTLETIANLPIQILLECLDKCLKQLHPK